MTERQEKFNSIIAKAAAEFILLESNRQALITVTGANVSPNLSDVEVYISVLPEKNEQKALDFLKRQEKGFYHFLKKKTRTRYIPHPHFILDRGERNRQLIEEISQDF